MGWLIFFHVALVWTTVSFIGTPSHGKVKYFVLKSKLRQI